LASIDYRGHGSHVTIKAIKQVYQFGLHMITLLFHTSHALQPLNVNCFKSFKITFKKEEDNAMVRNNHCELNKCMFISKQGFGSMFVQKKSSRTSLILEEYGHSILKPWMTRPN
jgi:hypothetical protein